MVLNDEQANRFFDTMDSLLVYVNERFQVVEGFTLDYDTQIGDMKATLVARALWENVEIIDEFVRENPARLSQRCLETALSWKYALPGMYTVVRYQGGRALMMNDVGVFSVGGVTLELEGEIGKIPAYVEMVLLPFDDGIVYDGFLQAFDTDGSAAEATRIQDEFENRCAQGIVSSGANFISVAGAHLASQRDKELDALLADLSREAAGVEEEPSQGFHRGALAGLATLEREAAAAEEFARRRQLPTSRGRIDSPAADPHPDPQEEHQPERQEGRQPQPNPQPDPQPDPQPIDIQSEQAMNCAIACVLSRGVVELRQAYDQYRELVPEPLDRNDFELLARHEASFSDSYFGLWSFQGRDYLAYYTLLPDYVTQMASRSGGWSGLREELDYCENYKQSLVSARAEIGPKPLSRTLLENTPLGELLRDSNVVRLRRFLDERIPDGEDDYTFADQAVQEFVLTSIEMGSLEEVFRLVRDLGLEKCTADEGRFARLVTNVFNAMPSWENNGWSPQELYEQLTGRRVFYNEDGTVKKVGGGEPCPCGSGLIYRHCCGR